MWMKPLTKLLEWWGLGGVVRDSEGTFLRGFYHLFHSICSAKHGELLALLLGVQLAQAHNFTPLIVESDCLVIGQDTNSKTPEFSDLDFLIEDLRMALQHTSAAQLRHVRCTANSVAHLLAREAATHGFSAVFFVQT